MKENETACRPDIVDLAKVLNCTEQDIRLAVNLVGNNGLKIQQFMKKKKVKDNGQYLKAYTI